MLKNIEYMQNCLIFGFAELILGRYISDVIPSDAASVGSLALAIAIIWRIISYYPYLIIGASIVPGWIQRSFYSHLKNERRDPKSFDGAVCSGSQTGGRDHSE
jgi:hypothetical protein